MLSKPNVTDLIPKIGNRYEVVMAVSKRAREISDNRIENEDASIEDAVDVASKEFYDDVVVLDEKNDFKTHDYIDEDEDIVNNVLINENEKLIDGESVEQVKKAKPKAKKSTKKE